MAKLNMKKGLQISVRIDGRIRKIDLEAELAINEPLITKQMMQQPSQYAFFGVLKVLALKRANKAKVDLKKLYGELDQQHRKHREDRGLKTTENIIEADILRDPEYISAQDDLIEAQHAYDIMSIVVESFSQRKDMLISVASNLRTEMDRDLSVLKKKAKDVMHRRKS